MGDIRILAVAVALVVSGCSNAAPSTGLVDSAAGAAQDIYSPGRKAGAPTLRVDLSAGALREASRRATLQLAVSDGTVIAGYDVRTELAATTVSGLVVGGGYFRIRDAGGRLEGAIDTASKSFHLHTNPAGETIVYEVERDEAKALDVRPYSLPMPWPPVSYKECNGRLTIAVGFTERVKKPLAADRIATLNDLQTQLGTLLREADPTLAVTLVDAGEVSDPVGSRDAYNLVVQLATDGDGLWDALYKNPEDLVFVLDNTDNRGAASSVGSTANSRFAVVNIEHASTTLTFSHEFGHLAGAGHELNGARSAAPGFTNGYGWVDKTNSQMTVMSTNSGYTRQLHFSHPTIWGSDDGNPNTDSAHVASVLRTTVPYLASLSCQYQR